MTNTEKLICRMYLEDLDSNHSCNEYRLLMDLIDNAPATGEWIVNKNLNNRIQCSKCGMFSGLDESDIAEGYELNKYCANCGADMRESANAYREKRGLGK